MMRTLKNCRLRVKFVVIVIGLAGLCWYALLPTVTGETGTDWTVVASRSRRARPDMWLNCELPMCRLVECHLDSDGDDRVDQMVFFMRGQEHNTFTWVDTDRDGQFDLQTGILGIDRNLREPVAKGRGATSAVMATRTYMRANGLKYQPRGKRTYVECDGAGGRLRMWVEVDARGVASAVLSDSNRDGQIEECVQIGTEGAVTYLDTDHDGLADEIVEESGGAWVARQLARQERFPMPATPIGGTGANP